MQGILYNTEYFELPHEKAQQGREEEAAAVRKMQQTIPLVSFKREEDRVSHEKCSQSENACRNREVEIIQTKKLLQSLQQTISICLPSCDAQEEVA